MDPHPPLLISLDSPADCHESRVGGKAAKLARLVSAGFPVPRAFCLTTWAYEAFLEDSKIAAAIGMELARKSMDEMRWEEIWDAALRIRSMFVAHPLPETLRGTIAEGLSALESSTPLAVRSSAVGEDSAGRSFAGLHESIIGVRTRGALDDAIRLVWASLWSDAALLYRKELGLDPTRSRMAVLVQEMVDAERSGVAFARDPRDTRKDQAIVEAVPGPCSLLVDGLVDPDRWEIDRTSGRVIAWLPGRREDAEQQSPLLEPRDLERILQTLLRVERLFGWSPDMEWTGRSDSLTVLQARPITTGTGSASDGDDKRAWYLSLRPGDARLKQLRTRVAEELIPQLQAEGQALAEEQLDRLDDEQLAAAIEKRRQSVARWKTIYWDEFIPFAHGVRRLATYYNDAVRPEDPYEFIALLRDLPLLAAQRNRAIGQLAEQLASNHAVRARLERLLKSQADSLEWPSFREELTRDLTDAEGFAGAFEDLQARFLDIAYDRERLHDQAVPLLRNLVELSHGPARPGGDEAEPSDSRLAVERRLLDAVGPERHQEAIEIIETGRLSWKLRDDDNLLVARMESQLLRALEVAARRLGERGRLTGDGRPEDSHAELLLRMLREPSAAPVRIERRPAARPAGSARELAGETPRQLIGQPASPGIATGAVRRIRGRHDLGAFRRGEVLVCDAIQPTMTHLVPLAGAIVERRGGMLIHGAIIARELGIPCVNGVRDAADVLEDGDLVTVDGHLGIVTVGPAELDLELGGFSRVSGPTRGLQP